MADILEFLKSEGLDAELVSGVESFRREHQVSQEYIKRIPEPEYYFYGKEIWKQAIASVLAGKNILLAGPKATGKNVLADNLAALFGRPEWNVSFQWLLLSLMHLPRFLHFSAIYHADRFPSSKSLCL